MLDTVDVVVTQIRRFLSVFDLAAYYLLDYVYQVFFNIVNFNFLNAEIIFDVISRVQLILGVFMMFQLAMTIIKGIINPDSFTDKKTGFGNVLMRIAVSLILLAMLVPLNIPSPRNEYEKQINNNGILFGTLYSLQRRVLANNTIGRLIFGNDSRDYTSSNSDSGDDLADVGASFSTTVLKSFYILNTDTDGSFICTDADDVEEAYNSDDVSVFDIIRLSTETCSSGTGNISYGFWGAIRRSPLQVGIDLATGEKVYTITMIPIISTIVGLILAILMMIMSFEVAVRALKLAALQLMAPIPIISYMDPKGGKDGAFNSWVKLLASTYLDLFIRLAVIYFAMDMVSMLITKMPSIISAANESSGANILIIKDTFNIIFIAIFIFAIQAPKFFKQMLGIKDNGGHFFSAFGDAIGLGATGLAAIGSFNAGRSASRMADQTNHDRAYADRFGNRAKHLVAGIFNAGKSLAIGSAAASESKGNALAKGMSAWKAMNKNNDEIIANGASGSTFVGRGVATASKVFQGSGNTNFDSETRAIAQKKNIKNAGKDFADYLKGKGGTDGANYNVKTSSIVVGQNADGSNIEHQFTGTVNDFYRAKAQAIADQQAGRVIGKTPSGMDIFADGRFTFGGRQINANDTGLMEKIEEELKFAAGDQWAIRQEQQHILKLGSPDDNNVKDWDFGYAQKKATYNESIKDADDPNKMGLYQSYEFVPGDVPANDRMSNTTTRVNKASKAAGGEAGRREADARYQRQQKDYGAIKKNG